MKRFLRIFLFLLVLHSGQFFAIEVIQGNHCVKSVTESILESGDNSCDRYSDYDAPCGGGTLTAPAPSVVSSERGDSYFGHSRRVKTSAFTHYALFREDKLLNRHSASEFCKLLSCRLSGVRSAENRLLLLCTLKI